MATKTSKTNTVLIADDDRDLAASLAIRCEAMGFATQVTHDGMTAVRMIDAMSPDVIILDVNMPGGNGLAVCELITSGNRDRSRPIIMLTGESEPETVRRCHEMCAYYVLKCPSVWERIRPLLANYIKTKLETESDSDDFGIIDSEETMSSSAVGADIGVRSESNQPPNGNLLIDAVFSALSPMESLIPHDHHPARAKLANVSEDSSDASGWILSIDDDPDMANSLRLRLKQYGIAVRRAYAGMEGYRSAFTEPAQAILLDYEMPNGNGDYVLRRLKENPVTRDIPVVVLTGRREKTIERTMYNLGAAAFLTKPYLWENLWAVLRPLLEIKTADAPRAATTTPSAHDTQLRAWEPISIEN